MLANSPVLHRRCFTFAFAVIAAGALAGAAVQPGHLTISLTPVAGGLTSPVSLTHAGDGSGRLFVVDQIGKIWIIANGQLLAQPFLDLTSQIVAVNRNFDERGLLGLAFHPQYSQNGRFFVRYSAPRPGAPGEPCVNTSRGCHREVLAEFHVSSDPNLAEPNGLVLLTVDKPQFNHNSGGIAFGPDGYLYFTLGDGGGANDGLADNPPSHGPKGNGQNIDVLLGKVHRIDVDAPAPLPYSAPPDNPFVGRAGRDEIYAFGFRNPYRFSFDRLTGLLTVGDVGQNMFEEVNIVQKGGNHGWVVREGRHCFDPFAPSDPPAACTDVGEHGEPLLDPVAEYDHTDGIAVVGGFVYRGSGFPELYGTYFFGDWSRAFFPPGGRLFYFEERFPSISPLPNRSGVPGAQPDAIVAPRPPATIREFDISGRPGGLGAYLLGLGEDESGELYVLTSQNGGPRGQTGAVWRVGPAQ